jgi:hypothetical protein
VFAQHVDPLACRRERQAVTGEVALDVSTAQADFEAPTAGDVHRGQFPGQQRRGVERRIEHQVATRTEGTASAMATRVDSGD